MYRTDMKCSNFAHMIIDAFHAKKKKGSRRVFRNMLVFPYVLTFRNLIPDSHTKFHHTHYKVLYFIEECTSIIL